MRPRMAPPKEPLAYDVRFERGKFVLAARRKRLRAALSASTEDARLTVPVRISALLVGLFCFAFGSGLIALIVNGIITQPSSAPAVIGVIPFLLVSAYGIDLVGRGITGWRWADRYWGAAWRRFAGGFKLWHGVALLLLFFGMPVLSDLPQKGWRAFAFLMVPLAMLAQVICHEIGHLFAAGSVGYRPRWMSAGPLLLHVDGPRPRLSWNRTWMMLFGGLAAYEKVRRTRLKDLWVVAAGPLANVLTAMLALEYLGWPSSEYGFLDTFLRTFIPFGFCVCLINLMPLPRSVDGFALDGRELLDLIRGRR